MGQRGQWAFAATALLFLIGIVVGWAANELMSPQWTFYEGGVRMNTRTGETWKMHHSTRQWVLYTDAPNGGAGTMQEQPDARVKEFEQKYGLGKQLPPLSLEELDRLTGDKPSPLTPEELERKYGVNAAPAKQP